MGAVGETGGGQSALSEHGLATRCMIRLLTLLALSIYLYRVVSLYPPPLL